MTQPGFFDFEECLASFSRACDPLESLSQTLDVGLTRLGAAARMKRRWRNEA